MTDDNQNVVADQGGSDEQDFADFEAEYYGDGKALKTEPKADESKSDAPEDEDASEVADHDAADQQDDADGEDGDEGEDKPAKPKKSAQDRINELYGKYRQEQREKEELLRRVEALEKGKDKQDEAAKPEQEDTPPDPEKYELGEADPQYIRDLVDYQITQREKVYEQQRLEREEQAQLQAKAQELQRNWDDKTKSVREKYPDFDELVNSDDLKVTNVMFLSAMNSENVGEIAYYVASNPDEAARISQLPALQQAVEIGKLDARFSAQNQPASTLKPKKIATNAPEPAPARARGAGGRFEIRDDTDDLEAFERKYYAPN